MLSALYVSSTCECSSEMWPVAIRSSITKENMQIPSGRLSHGTHNSGTLRVVHAAKDYGCISIKVKVRIYSSQYWVDYLAISIGPGHALCMF
jgi:hypothetical protein